MALMRVQVQFPWDSGLPEDVTTNTFYFAPAAVTTGAASLAFGNLKTFYDTVSTTYRVRDTFSSLLTGAMLFKAYDMADPTPRVPVNILADSLSAVPSTALMPEAAICLSYQADAASGVAQARRRGRIFLGPLNNSVFASTTDPHLLPAFAIAIADSAARLEDDAVVDSQPWSVYSPTLNQAFPITNGWVDNEFDTQRRRGIRATSRITWS